MPNAKRAFWRTRTFWTSAPGILTGLAGLVAALGGVYLGITQSDKPRAETTRPAAATASSTTATPTDWPSVASETFTSLASACGPGAFLTSDRHST